MSICQAIMHEIMAYEKFNGKKPALLILVDKEFKDQFFSECYEYIMRTDGLDFKTPGQFFGVPFYWKKIHCYGGSTKWMLVGDDT